VVGIFLYLNIADAIDEKKVDSVGTSLLHERHTYMREGLHKMYLDFLSIKVLLRAFYY